MSSSSTTLRRSPQDMLSTGLTVLNLQLSGYTSVGLPKGCIAHYAGDSDSGKTVAALSVLAEAANNPHFDGYDLRFWNAEDGAQMDRDLFYGKKMRKRLIETVPEYLDEFYLEVLDTLTAGKRPFVGVVDSMDVLIPKAWEKKVAKDRKALKGEETSGDFGAAKAKMNSEYLRKIRTRCNKTGSILILISQVRDNLNAGPFGDKRSISGGRAYKYYSVAQIITSTKSTLTKEVLGKTRSFGIQAQIEVKKNHINGNKGRVYGMIVNDMGLDDVGSNIEYLINEGHWSSSNKQEGKGKVTCPEFSDKAIPRDKLAHLIESQNEEKKLRGLVRKVYIQIQESLKTNRKTRYE